MVAAALSRYSPSPPRWTVQAPGRPAVQICAENWITALGRALEQLGEPVCSGRLAAEMLPNGVVIANDLSAGLRYVVQRG